MSETIEARAGELGSRIWNGHFTTAEERRDGLEIWRRVAEHIREGLQKAGDAGPGDERPSRRLPASTPVAQPVAVEREGGGTARSES